MNLLIFSLQLVPMPQSVALSIILIGIAYAVFAIVLQRKINDPKKMRALQKQINDLTKEINEMAKRKEDVTEKQKLIMPLMGDTMKLQMRTIFVVLPLFFLVYYGAIPFLYHPFFGTEYTIIYPMSYQTLFFATVFVLGFVLSFAILEYDKRKAKEEAGESSTSSQMGRMTK